MTVRVELIGPVRHREFRLFRLSYDRFQRTLHAQVVLRTPKGLQSPVLQLENVNALKLTRIVRDQYQAFTACMRRDVEVVYADALPLKFKC